MKPIRLLRTQRPSFGRVVDYLRVLKTSEDIKKCRFECFERQIKKSRGLVKTIEKVVPYEIALEIISHHTSPDYQGYITIIDTNQIRGYE